MDGTDLVEALEGSTILELRRKLYVFEGSITSDRGPIEITTDRGALVLDVSSGYEFLRVIEGRLVDPFEGELSPENEEFVATHGKWTVFDMSSEAVAAYLIGFEIRSVELVRSEWLMAEFDSGSVAGAVIKTAEACITVMIGDELGVSFETI